MQRITPNIWSAGTAQEQGEFYARAIPLTTTSVMSRYPTDGLPEFQQSLAGQPLTVDIVVDGYTITMINAGDEYRPNPTMSFILTFDAARFGGDDGARTALQNTWDALVDGAEILLPVDEYPFSARYGWLRDRYDVSWQVMLTNPEGEPRSFVMPQLMFCGPAQNRAREAIDYYTSLFGDSSVDFVAPYPQATGPAASGAVMFSVFRLNGQFFSAMDSGVEQPYTFDPGMSLAVDCDDQTEIDRLWDALSSVPEAEACGWCTDRFGLSWQIVPTDIVALLARPDAHAHMMQMRKLVIADF